VRAGTYALSLLATPGVVSVLRALKRQPMPLADLRRSIGSPPQTTLRVQLRELTGLGVLERSREQGFPRSVRYELTEPGRELLAAADPLQCWLDGAPTSTSLGEITAKRIVKALADGWEAGLVSLIAAEPRSLTQLNHEIPWLSYPSLERRLAAMRGSGLVEVLETKGQGSPCRPTAWLRHAAVPIAAASRFERSHLASAQDARIDIQALLMLAMPIVDFPRATKGVATMVTRQRGGQAEESPAPEAVRVEIQDGQSESCIAAVERGSQSWVIGAPEAWLDAVLDGVLDRLRIGGAGADFAEGVVGTLHATLSVPKASKIGR
jgi:DNA-binding HxlR family transcriptional regulator